MQSLHDECNKDNSSFAHKYVQKLLSLCIAVYFYICADER